MDSTPGYAEIIISIAHKDVDRVFCYKIPDNLKPLVKIGVSVTVPFGRGNRHCEGFVTGFTNTVEYDEKKIKSIAAVNDVRPFFTAPLLELAEWMRYKYYTTLFDCLKCIMPTGMQFRNDVVVTLTPDASAQRLGVRQKAVLDLLQANNGKLLQSEIENEFGGKAPQMVKALHEKGLVYILDVSEFKDLTLGVRFAFVNYDNENLEETLEELIKKRSPQAGVLQALMTHDGMAVSDIKKLLHISNSPVQSLVKNDLIKIETVEVLRNTINYDAVQPSAWPALTLQQQQALHFFEQKNDDKPVLLHGITGSGKTEIYMRLIQRAIDAGKQAIMLVPEISLTPQMVDVFLRRFGRLVSVTHSRLTLGERYDQWKNARDGRMSIMIGPRSALFAPFNNLGVIIIDEEHEKTYKSETTPKYAAKDVAIRRGKLEGALVVLGSATPSVESYYEAEQGDIDLVKMPERINRTLPDVFIVDMRIELEQGNMSIFSAPLFDAIEKNLSKGEQTILFLNRRGFSTFVSCRKCGYVMKCDDCNVSFTYHLAADKLLCHYCGKKTKNPTNCPQCGSKFIKYFGVGTQKIEDEVKRLFPGAKVLRMDTDTTSGKHTHERILNRFRNQEAQILIGTQMIAKGLDFPNVTLVGIVAADLSLNNGDFRAGETTYQLLTQVSGRAGRAAIAGRVFIQTYNPEHYSILYAKDNNYEQFYAHEITLRRQMTYPPFSHVFSVLATGEDEKRIIVTLFKLLEIMKFYNRKGLFEMLGPSPATISKIRKRYRWKLIVKSVDEEKLKNFVLYCVDKLKQNEDMTQIILNLTLNPVLLV